MHLNTYQHFLGQRLALTEYDQQRLYLTLNNCDGVNTFDQQMLEELNHCLTLLQRLEPKGLTINSAQRLFLAGGNIKEFQQRFAQTSDERIASLQAFGDALSRLSSLPCPTIAMLEGTTLGGGVELALSCDYRIALPTIKIGLPEVTLGIIPGTGGSVRLPRLIGVERSLEWICHGRIHNGEEAYQARLVDRLGSTSEQLEIIAQELMQELQLHPEAWQQKRASVSQDTNCDQETWHNALSSQYQDDSQQARLSALHVISSQPTLSMPEALLLEAQTVSELGASSASQRLVRAFVEGS